jgi:hypothetical protein
MADADLRYEIVYQEALRALTSQDQRLEAVRNRASAVLGAASISQAVLAAPAIKANGVNVWAWLAFASLALLTTCVIAILWPTRGWEFRLGIAPLLSGYVEASRPADINEMRRELALHIEEAYEGNRGRLERRYALLRASAVLLAVGVAVWFVDLAWG